MADKVYKWTDDPMLGGVKDCDPDVVNECLMSLKYENTTDAIQNMYTTGQVETQTRGFNQLQQMRHSTFDLSKFTVVGSPTISDDGVASGFGRLQKEFSIINQKFKIKGSFTFGENLTSFQCCFELFSENINRYIISVRPISDNILAVCYYNGTGTEVSSYSQTEVPRIVNKTYQYEIEIDGTTAKSTINGITKTINNFVFSDVTAFSLGNAYATLSPFYGSIDLKHFSITVDGKEVFSGNKTGLDVIKPDNYEVVGSTTISDDGVASGLNNPNYVNTTITYGDIKDKSWTFANRVYIDQTASSYILFDNSYKTLGSVTYSSGLKFCARFGDATSSTAEIYVASLGIVPIGWYDISISFNIITGIYTLYAKNIETGNEYENTYTPPTENKQLHSLNTKSASTIFRISSGGSGIYLTCDLNSFKIYVDGNLVYQPCLKIPYTESKTGSKIVDAVYRDRVIDLYEQQGQAGYYTIDEENKNFTLPMGEVYGMFVSKSGDIMSGPLSINTRWNDKLAMIHPDLDINSTTAPEQSIATHVTAIDKNGKWVGNFGIDHASDNKFIGGIVVRRIIDGTEKRAIFQLGVDASGNTFYNPHQLITSYANGTSGYNIWSNGYCEQWGQYHATGHRTITFAKKFKDTNYNITCTTNDSGISYAWFDASQSSASKVYLKVSDTSRGITVSWRACGYLATGQY